MAISMTGFLGTYSGSMGPLVFYTAWGRQCVRQRVVGRNPRTEAQQAGRRVFGTVSTLAAQMKHALRVGMQGEAERRHMGGRNLFVSLNRHCVTVTAGEVEVDYASLQLSAGSLTPSVYGAPRQVAPLRVEVAVSDPPGQKSLWHGHSVYLFAYAPQTGMGWLSDGLPLHVGLAAIDLPQMMAGQEMHLYAFVADCCRQASETSYLGCLTVSELEVDKGLEVGGDELENHEDGGDDHEGHEPQGHAGEGEAVAALEAFGQPVDHHAGEEDKEGGAIVGQDVGRLGEIPVRANLVYHLRGRAPGHFVGLGGVEVGAAAEEKTRETDEDEGEAGVPDG